MRAIYRGIAAMTLSAPLALGLSGIASADSFEHSHSQAGPDGASSSKVESHTGGGEGQASYEKSTASAGPDGASSSSTKAHAGGDSDNTHHSEHGGVLTGLLG